MSRAAGGCWQHGGHGETSGTGHPGSETREITHEEHRMKASCTSSHARSCGQAMQAAGHAQGRHFRGTHWVRRSSASFVADLDLTWHAAVRSALGPVLIATMSDVDKMTDHDSAARPPRPKGQAKNNMAKVPGALGLQNLTGNFGLPLDSPLFLPVRQVCSLPGPGGYFDPGQLTMETMPAAERALTYDRACPHDAPAVCITADAAGGRVWGWPGAGLPVGCGRRCRQQQPSAWWSSMQTAAEEVHGHVVPASSRAWGNMRGSDPRAVVVVSVVQSSLLTG